MARLRFTELQSRPMEFLDFTSLTLDEFQQLVPPFEAAFHARMAAWRMDGKPRTARRFAVYKKDPQEGTCDKTSFALPHAWGISVYSFCTGSSTIKSPIAFLPLLER